MLQIPFIDPLGYVSSTLGPCAKAYVHAMAHYYPFASLVYNTTHVPTYRL